MQNNLSQKLPCLTYRVVQCTYFADYVNEVELLKDIPREHRCDGHRDRTMLFANEVVSRWVMKVSSRERRTLISIDDIASASAAS